MRHRHHRRHRRHRGLSGAAAAGCHPAGIKANGRLRKGFRWRHGRKGCAIPTKG